MAAIRFDDRNFCIGTYVGTFCSIDDANNRLVTKNTSNGVVGTQYSLNPVLSSDVLSLEYTGPRNLAAGQFNGPLPFYSLDTSYIRYWELNNVTGYLVQNSSVANDKNYTAMAIEHYYTTFSFVASAGTNFIKVNDYSRISIGDKLLLGPSYAVGNDGAYEWVYVTDISDGNVYVSSELDDDVPILYNYGAGNNITFSNYIYAFSNNGYIDKLDLSYNVVETIYSGLYSNILCAAWSTDYYSIGFIRQDNPNLLYMDPYQDYQILKSHIFMTTKADKLAQWRVYGLAFDTLAVYRLQQGETVVDDNGSYIDSSFNTYSYCQDTISPYTKSITVSAFPSALVLNNDVIVLIAVVRDQYGVGLLGKEVYFFESDSYGQFDPITGIATTDADGIAFVMYDLNKPGGDPISFPSDGILTITVRTDGASSLTGSQYVWDKIELRCKRRFDSVNDGLIRDINNEHVISTGVDQWVGKSLNLLIDSFSKFSFPGGNWTPTGAPNDTTPSVEQLSVFKSDHPLDQISNTWPTDNYVKQVATISKTGQLSQTFVSRHVLTGHQDSTVIDQFQFIADALPPFWSEKNPVGTNIWIRLRPFAYSLNQSSLVFKVKEISYDGDTGWVDVTSSCVVTTFNAGGGLLGLDVLYDPPLDFHHGGMVYVDIVVYDNAPVPNIIVTDYWFKIIHDYKTPYIINENPSRGEENVPINSSISFDVLDAGVGVDISTLELYIGNRKKTPITTEIVGGYHVLYDNPNEFFYGETVEVTVKVRDASANRNFLHDMWRFYIGNSTGPWIDIDSFYPKNCIRGMPRKMSEVSFNVYGINDTGIDADSILVYIGGRERSVTITPIIYRIG